MVSRSDSLNVGQTGELEADAPAVGRRFLGRVKFVRSKEYVRRFCCDEQNAKRWIRFRGRTGYNYRHQHAFFERIVGNIPIPEGARILDLCCGEGSLLREYRKARPDRAFEAHALDISWWLVDHVRADMPDVRVVQGDAFQLPYADGSFDMVFDISISGMFPHASYAHLVREIHRVLRPSGVRVTRHNNRYSLFYLVEQAKYDFVKHAYTRSLIRSSERQLGFTVRRFIGDYLAPTAIFYRHEKTGLHRRVPEWVRAGLYHLDVNVLARLMPWFTASVIAESEKT